jgi:hypothetical protein
MSLTVADVQSAKRREDLVPGYVAWLRQYAQGEAIDVAAVNHAIMARWSVSALTYIKRRAWKAAFR